MRVLILGGTGTLGHKLWQMWRKRFNVWVTSRAEYDAYARYELFDPERFLAGVEALDFDSVIRAVAEIRPDVVVNAVGIVKQVPSAKDPLVSLSVNSLLPHRLALLCRSRGARLVHVSTDCVFSGRKGMYTEDAVADAEDLYGRSKLLGEVTGPGCLTLRTSLLGRELASSHGLLEWFLGSRGGRVQGYSRAIYSGFPTATLAEILADVIERFPGLSGLYHVSSDPISKYALLELIRDAYRLPVEIEPFPKVVVDRSLDSRRFTKATGFASPPWRELVEVLASDPTPYDAWRQARAS